MHPLVGRPALAYSVGTPCGSALQAAINNGSYLSLGEALVRTKKLNGFVINQAEAGATTFARLRCGWNSCMTLGWKGYDVQFQKALSRVAMTNPENPTQIVYALFVSLL